MIPLIPGSNDAASTDVFALDQKKGAWQPAHAQLRTKSFPTPFAQAEMMAHVLAQLVLDAGAQQPRPELVNDRLQQSFERWRLLLLGVVLGEVLVETVDLLRPEADRFGRMLADLRPECRFLGMLRDARRAGGDGRGLLVGATDPSCLLWCAPRPAREGYWGDLKARVDANADRGEAVKVLAEWRAAFDRNGAWAPSNPASPPWQKALQVLLGDAPPGGANLLADVRGAGPVRLAVAPRPGGEAADVVVYLPRRQPGWAVRFSELLFFQPVRAASGAVELVDPNGRPVVTIAMAPRDVARGAASAARGGSDAASTAGYELLSGVGRLEPVADVGKGHGLSHWLDDQPGAPGYRSLVLAPLLNACAGAQRRPSVTEADVAAFPMLYPDAVRMVAAQAGAEEPGGVRIHLSRAVVAALDGSVAAPQTGTPLVRWQPGDALPRIVAAPSATGALAAGLVERFGPSQRSVDVGELRGLGLGLWLYFVGDAQLRSDGARVTWSAFDDRELFGRAVQAGYERSIEVFRDALAAVRADEQRERARDRLATLQRFAATWRAVGEGDDPSTWLGPRLGRVAAETFVAWVLDGSGFALGRFGTRSRRAGAHFELGGGARLPLFADAVVDGA